MDGVIQFTTDQMEALMGRIAAQAADAAVKAINTVPDEARPAVVSNVNLKRTPAPRLGRAMKALYRGSWKGAEFERDIVSATKEQFRYSDADFDSGRSIVWYKDMGEARDVFDLMGERDAVKNIDRVDGAIKAMAESGSYALTGGTSGGILVPPEFRQDAFAYALAPEPAVRRAGVRVMPVTSNNVRLPRESVRAGASQASEAGQLTAADATFAQQPITIEKQYGYREFSNELMDDADPSMMEFIGNTVVRDLKIQQDIQYLRGTGSTPQITGILSFSGTTTPPSFGTAGRTPTWDDVLDALYALEAANVTGPIAAISHPRFANSMRKQKDAEGRYVVTGDGTPNTMSANLGGILPLYKTTNLLATQTVGASTDCTTVIVFGVSQMVILERKGIEIAMSKDIKFDYDSTAVRAIARSAIATLQPESVELVVGVRP